LMDENNCSESVSFNVGNTKDNGLAVNSASISDETCGNNNGAIDIAVSGGTGTLSYLWSNGTLTQDVSGLAEGNYTVTVTDANSCSVSANYTVANNSGTLTATGQTASSMCNSNNGSITQTITGTNGAVQFQWSNGATTQNISGLAPGTYSCTISDAAACSVTYSYTVGQSTGNVSFTGTLITTEVCTNNPKLTMKLRIC